MKGRDSVAFDEPRKSAARRPRDQLFAWTCTAGVHGIVLAIFLPRLASLPAQPMPIPSVITASLLDQHKAKPPRRPDMTISDDERDPLPATRARRSTSAPVTVADSALDDSDSLSEAELSGAAIPGQEGTEGVGGGCNTALALQRALRADPLVRTAVMGAGRQGKVTRVWNGDWVQSGGQDGKGLSVVREAILWELAFAPPACRDGQMHGTLLLSLADGETQFAIGSGDWRWSDLLTVRKARPPR
jgi:hypothetical protein